VTTNAAQGETFFTEATFEMPAFDATVDYELVMAAMTASADQIAAQTYKLKVGTNEHGTVTASQKREEIASKWGHLLRLKC